MKIISKSEDEKTFLFKVTKMEHEVIDYVIEHDDTLSKNFEILTNKTECLIVQLSGSTIGSCIGYLNHCFASEVVSQIIRTTKIKKLKDGIHRR